MLAGADAGIEEAPKLGALIFRVPLSERVAKREDALLGARLFFVTTCTANAGVEAEFGNGVEQRHGLMTVTAFSGIAQNDTSLRDRIFHRAHDQAFTELRGAMIAKGDDLRKIVSGIDVQQRKGKRTGAECLFRQAQQHQGILAAGKEQGRVAALARNFAQDVNCLRFEPAEMIGIGRARQRKLVGDERGLYERGIGHAGTPSARTITSSGRRCSPHSLSSALSHHQRPARISSPGRTARVHGAQPMLG